jgi:hypothetical protein
VFNRQSDEFGRKQRTLACARGLDAECPHMLGFGGGFNPRRLRYEAGIGLCTCDCHASCPVSGEMRQTISGRITIPARTWLESCTCPGAEAARTSLDQAGLEFPDFDELWSRSRQQHQSRRDAFDAARAQAGGKNREEIREVYLAELRSRGQEISSQEALDANVAALAGDYLPVARLIGRAVVGSVKFFRVTRSPR